MPDDRPAGPEPHQLPPPAMAPHPGEQMGLGKNWTPHPTSWEWRTVGTNAGPLHVLVLNTAAGRTAVAFDADSLGRMIAQAQERITGLTLPGGGLGLHLPGNGATP